MKLRTKAAIWFRLGQQQKLIVDNDAKSDRILELVTESNLTVGRVATFTGDLAMMVADLHEDVAVLAEHAGHPEIAEGIHGRMEIATALIDASQITWKEEQNG